MNIESGNIVNFRFRKLYLRGSNTPCLKAGACESKLTYSTQKVDVGSLEIVECLD